jgi:hypothetical protein
MVSDLKLQLAALICFRLRITEEACSADNFEISDFKFNIQCCKKIEGESVLRELLRVGLD